jgi:adenine-specific DNA-methyltransferase
MAKIDITRTELVWPGKYNDDGSRKEVPRVHLPFQVIETINQSRATREAEKQRQSSLFDIWEGKEGDTFEAGWKNKLIWGDNLLVMGSLLEKFAGKIDLIYIDPPFATGADFTFTSEIGEGDLKVTKEQSILEEKAYRDTWGKGLSSFLVMMHDRLALIRDLLAPHGSLYIHLDATTSYLVRCILDELLGSDSFCNHIIWSYKRWPSVSNIYQRMHDDILFYRKDQKGSGIRFKVHYEDVSESYQKRFKGKTQVLDPETRTRKITIDEPTKGLPLRDVWEISIIAGVGNERLGFPTQKPEALLTRILETNSRPGDLVADFLCGSGTTLAVAERLGRRWIGCDLGRYAIHVTRKRLLGIEGCKPFKILNLGKYERQYWQGVTFGGKGKSVPSRPSSSTWRLSSSFMAPSRWPGWRICTARRQGK